MQLNEMEFWIDLNLPPKMASWLIDGFGVKAKSFKELNLDEFDDATVYKLAAKNLQNIIITTKDIDFSNLQNAIGSPPQILYLNVGNVTNKKLKEIIDIYFKDALKLLQNSNNKIVEITI